MPYIDRYRMFCPACGAHISSDYKKCPRCGLKIKKEKGKKGIFWLVLLVVLLAGVIAFTAYAYNHGGPEKYFSHFSESVNAAVHNLSEKISGIQNSVGYHSQKESEAEESEEYLTADLKPAEETANTEDNFETEIGFEEIYTEYSRILTEKTPVLISEFLDEAKQLDSGFSACAELCAEKIKILAELSNEGTEKMGSLLHKSSREQYEKYNEWAAKLSEIYKQESQKIKDAYTDFIMQSENVIPSRSMAELDSYFAD